MTTTLHDAVKLDGTKPGWLRRAWAAGLASQQSPGPAHCGEERGFLLHGTIPETLEPFISLPATGRDDDDLRILHFTELDSGAASSLLQDLPPSSLEQDFSMYAPPTGTMLRVIADNPGVVIGEGSAYSPQLPAEAIRVRGLDILDPSLADVGPDVVPLDLPAWIEDLPQERYAEYLKTRQWCLDHGVTRPAWVTAVGRYGIVGARRFPHMSLMRNESGEAIGVRFQW